MRSIFLIAVMFTSVGLLSRESLIRNTALHLSEYLVTIDVSDLSFIGLSLTYTISLSGAFQYMVRKSTEVENIVSIIFN